MRVRVIVLAAALFGLLADGASASVPAPSFGAPYPGALITPQPVRNACSHHYKFVVRAAPAKIADFYLSQGNLRHMTLLGDTRSKFPDYRMISFAGDGRDHLLFVTISRVPAHVSGAVLYTVNDRPCGN